MLTNKKKNPCEQFVAADLSVYLIQNKEAESIPAIEGQNPMFSFCWNKRDTFLCNPTIFFLLVISNIFLKKVNAARINR